MTYEEFIDPKTTPIKDVNTIHTIAELEFYDNRISTILSAAQAYPTEDNQKIIDAIIPHIPLIIARDAELEELSKNQPQ